MANYQLAISNIAWHKEDDEAVYTAMQAAPVLPDWRSRRPASSRRCPTKT